MSGLTMDIVRKALDQAKKDRFEMLDRMHAAIAAPGTSIAHCPCSDAALGSGIFPLARHLDAGVHLVHARRRRSAGLGLDAEVGDFRPGKAADFVHLRPSDGSVLAAVLRRAESLDQALAALFTLAGSESVREVRVEGAVVYRAGEV